DTHIEDINLSFFLSQETNNTEQHGINSLGIWKASHQDKTTTAGLSAVWKDFVEKIDLGLNYQFAAATDHIKLKADTAPSALPDIKADRHTVEAFVKYKHDEMLNVNASFIFENYNESDWHFDDLNYDSINVLRGTGGDVFSYTAYYFMTSLTYRF
ncbi:MAG: MtrB/PioB family outer membrane beta-barrel protein, partial [Gammaproteobacteria bacterium]|nr:MtrB/PioB family outer membrane beta-barrel protein [Gammaproteobacteria bacterium]